LEIVLARRGSSMASLGVGARWESSSMASPGVGDRPSRSRHSLGDAQVWPPRS
jgi:hypothetical protein